jgi:hypothetical protein
MVCINRRIGFIQLDQKQMAPEGFSANSVSELIHALKECGSLAGGRSIYVFIRLELNTGHLHLQHFPGEKLSVEPQLSSMVFEIC